MKLWFVYMQTSAAIVIALFAANTWSMLSGLKVLTNDRSRLQSTVRGLFGIPIVAASRPSTSISARAAASAKAPPDPIAAVQEMFQHRQGRRSAAMKHGAESNASAHQ